MFETHMDKMNKACELLSKNPESGSTLGRLVCSGLEQISTQPKIYDAAVTHEYPFKKHFLEMLASLHRVEEDTFLQLFEDLALFVRSRALAFGTDTLSPAEKEILHHFETSGQWQRNDRALVTESYWYDLPQKIQAK